MSLIRADRVLETTTTTGTGALTLGGAVTGYQTFDAAMADGDTCFYSLEAVDGDNAPTGAWETGLGTFGASVNTLTRTTVYASSTGSRLTLAAGTKRVILTVSAKDVADNLVNQAVIPGTPELRGTPTYAGFNDSTQTVDLPTGSAEGDLCLVYAEHGYPIDQPTGFVEVNAGNAGYTFGRTYGKILDDDDITAGDVTVTFGGGYPGSVVIAVIDGSTMSRVVTQAFYNSSGGGTINSQSVSGLFEAQETDLILVFVGTRGDNDISVTGATELVANNQSGTSLYLGTYALTGGGKFGVSLSVSAPSYNEGVFISLIAIRGL